MVQDGKKYTDGYVLYAVTKVSGELVHYVEFYPEGDCEHRLTSRIGFERDVRNGTLTEVSFNGEDGRIEDARGIR